MDVPQTGLLVDADPDRLSQVFANLLTNSARCLVAMTGYGQADDRGRSRDAGFSDHLVKPFEMVALIDSFGEPEPDGRRPDSTAPR